MVTITTKLKGIALLRRPATDWSELDRSVGAVFITTNLTNHCVLDDARCEAPEFELHLITERTVQRWRLKTEGFKVERLAAAQLSMKLKRS